MDLKNFLVLLAAIVNLFLGIFIYSKGRNRAIKKSFALITFGVFCWSLGIILYRVSPDVSSSIFWCKILYSSPPLIVASFIYFAYIFPFGKIKKSVYLLITLLTSFSIILTLFTDLIIKDVLFRPGQEKFVYFGIMYYYFYIAFILGIFLWGYIILLKKIFTNEGKVRIQLIYAFLGLFFASIFGMFFNLLLPTFGNFDFNFAGQISALALTIFTAYAIIRHRFLGIKVIVSNIYLYILLAIFTFSAYHFVYFITSKYLDGVYGIKSISFGIFIAVIFSILFLPFMNYMQRFSDVLFYNGKNPKRIVKDFIIKMNQTNNLPDFYNFLHREFINILDTEEIKFFLIKYLDIDSCGDGFIFNKDKDFILNLNKDISRNVVIKHELSSNNLLGQKFNSSNMEIALPLFLAEEFWGYLFLSQKISNDAYTKEELEFLEEISPRIIESLFKILENKKLKQLNNGLVESQEDFLKIISDKIRTPVYKIKSILDLARKDQGKHKDKIIGKTFLRAEKLSQLLDNTVLASGIDSNILKFEFVPTDLKRSLEDVIEVKENLIKEKGINLEYKLGDKDIKILSNRAFLLPALNNLIDNAIRFSLGGKVKVGLEVEKERAKIVISDMGIGIPEQDKEIIFEKFKKAANYDKAYKKGLGLGLYVAKHIIEAHEGGKLYIQETETGNGSVFIVEMPLFKL